MEYMIVSYSLFWNNYRTIIKVLILKMPRKIRLFEEFVLKKIEIKMAVSAVNKGFYRTD